MIEQLALLPVAGDDGGPMVSALDTFPFRRTGRRRGVGQVELILSRCAVCGASFHAHQLGRRPRRCPDCARRRRRAS